MKNQACNLIQEKWVSAQKAGALPDEELREIKSHMETCFACREFAYEKNLFPLITESRNDTPYEPSAVFYEKLSRRIAATELPDESMLFSELMVKTGLKLVPAMAALVLFLAGTLAYFSKDDSSTASLSSFDEVVLFDDSPVSEDMILSAFINNEV